MWSSAVRRGARIGVSKLGSSASTGSWRALSSAGAPPLGEGGMEFQTKMYPSFWSRLVQQKQGLGNMALSASIAFLAISLIKQEKELQHANESAGRLRKQNEALTERLEGLRSGLVKLEAGDKTESDLVTLLRDVLDGNDDARVDPPPETDKPAQSPSRSKFMV